MCCPVIVYEPLAPILKIMLKVKCNIIYISGWIFYIIITSVITYVTTYQFPTTSRFLFPWFTQLTSISKDHSGYRLRQWETTLYYNVVSHCLSLYPELAKIRRASSRLISWWNHHNNYGRNYINTNYSLSVTTKIAISFPHFTHL